MALASSRLSAKSVQSAKSPTGKKPRLVPDGGGLYLQITPAGAKSWVYRFELNGRERYMGLGSEKQVSLAKARDAATDCRRLRSQGLDPIESRERKLADTAAASKTFADCAAAYIASRTTSWRSAKHAAQWKSTLDRYVGPKYAALPVRDYDQGVVMAILEPVWSKKPETASRVRGRIEMVLDWARVSGFRSGENPARWRGHLDKLLPPRARVRKVKHFAALPYTALSDFMFALHHCRGLAARALEFTILTAARTGEVIGSTEQEINVGEKVWTIAAERMKAGVEHRVPLSLRALAILEETRSLRDTDAPYLFPGQCYRKPISNMTMSAVLRRMGQGDITVHGFRSTFRDWAAECTNFQNEVIEMALAHSISDKTEAAYRRGALFDKRRRLMDAWATFCSGEPSLTTSEARDAAYG